MHLNFLGNEVQLDRFTLLHADSMFSPIMFTCIAKGEYLPTLLFKEVDTVSR